jgi:hypothetical protein
LETSADLITSVSVDAAKMEAAPNSISVSRHAISTQTAQLAAAPSATVVTQICAVEGKLTATFAIMERNVKWVIVILERKFSHLKLSNLQIKVMIH